MVWSLTLGEVTITPEASVVDGEVVLTGGFSTAGLLEGTEAATITSENPVFVAQADDHAFAFYVEDWGGLAYFAASIRVDGQVVAATGSGEFASTGGISTSSINEWPRIADWANVPDDSADSLNLLFSPGVTWGDWMEIGFDDSAWDDDTNVCTSPSYWNTTDFDTNYTTFGELAADGAEFVWHDFGYWSQGYCYSVGDSGTAWRTEVSL
ncbi:MAG: hypothetical protein ACI8RZ_000825 [Myxococcota bacterium]|jgi:hypothetical protein